jgi:L-ascorbate metabolism protein UlaG (beta-lactamase superfamily)
MQVSFLGADRFRIKTKNATLLLEADTVDIEGVKITGPGEYERKGIFVEGISPNGNGPIYTIRVENMTLCYLGNLEESISEEAAKKVGDIDILFVPLGENGTISEKIAMKVISQIDPRTVIPMQYSNISNFKNAEGIKTEDLDELKIKKQDLPEEERKFYILKKKG